MTPQDKASKLREVFVASDPTNHGALVGRVDASQFPIGGPDGVGHVSPGPNPYDLLSASLAACTAMTVRFHARRRKFPLERVEVGVSFHHGAQGERVRSIALSCWRENSTRNSAHSCWRPQTSAPLAKFSALVRIYAHARTPLLPATTQALRSAMRMIWLNSGSRMSIRIERPSCRRSLHRGPQPIMLAGSQVQ